MLWLISSGVRLRTLVVAVAVGLLILGAIDIKNKQLDVIPELALPSLTVKTESLGLSSAEVESLITVPLEADLLNGVPWLQVIQSESMAGLSTIEMIFAPGTDLMKARQMVQERLTQAHALPNVSSPPVMLQPVSSTSRVMNIGLSSKSVSPIDMSIQARWNIAPRLAGVPGVANVSIWGQRERQVQVLVDGRNLLKKGVKLEQVIKTTGEAVWSSPLTYLNSSTPGTGGFIETPNQRLSIRHQLPISTVGTFAKVPLSGTTVRVGDVALLAEGHQALIGDAIIGDGPGLMLAIEKFPGFNTSGVTRGVERALDELKPGLPGIEINTAIYHPASFIERATRNLSTAATISVVLVAVVLGLLMGSWRAAAIALAAISLSFVSAVLLLQAAGISLSMMVIGGLLMASGVVVHDGILDSDNLLRRLRAPRDGQSGFFVLARAMLETRRPMVYASLIVVLAVLPVLFMQSRSAAFFAPMAWAYIAAVSVSMLVALILTPALAAFLLVNVGQNARGDRPIDQWAGILDRVGGPVTRWPIASVGVAVAAAIACFAIVTPLERNMVPSFKETDLLIEWQGPPGTSLQAMMRSTEGLIQDLKQIPGVQNAHANLGRALLCNCEHATDVNTGQVWVNIDPKAHYETVVDAVEAAITAYPGMRGQVGTYLSTKLREALTGDPDSITVRVYGKSLDVIRTKAEEIRGAIAKIQGIENARVELQVEEPAIEVKVDVDRAADFGLKPGDVRRATSALVGGITVGALFEEQKVFDVVVWGRPELRDNIEDIRNLMIISENGSQARLAQVADVRVTPTTSIIRRQGASRRIDVLAKVDERALGDVAEDVARTVKQVAFPFEHRAEVLGEYKEQGATLRSIYAYVVAAAIVMFLLMQAVLRSWKLTALSLLGVPIAVLGGLAAIPVTEEGTLSLGSLMGLAAVLALTVRQGVGLVAHFQHLQLNEGEPFGAALVRRGVREQFPSVMTSSIATLALVLPFAVMGDVAGLEIAHPLAVVVLGGVVTATLGTLLMLPALYVRFAAGWINDRIDLEMETAS
ncbi:efflux RND transporter permease subunit [Bradyrhizobium japonicum]|uniref:efflux RND transporter permease subunit n=1 Tax=Bradyrhizobium japonicum TaxID=375 RepID=UPI001BAAFE80|nr:efflux RND transporter permease subunit [Bradyrhizobium japonicum]MBR0916268.1 efflux RND transporter permease subunit [Bradyrhizobium japonicum]